MPAVVEVLRKWWPVLIAFAWMISVLLAQAGGDSDGYTRGKAQGDAAIATLKSEYDNQRAQAAEEALLLYRQQATRANDAEARLLTVQDDLDIAKKQLQERIPNVTTIYRPARNAAPVAIPRAVFTCGWLRDYNAALGAADLPPPAACTAAAGSAETAWPAPGTDAELLESGVTQADILAHATDYGRWARNNAAQLNALIDLNSTSKEAQP